MTELAKPILSQLRSIAHNRRYKVYTRWTTLKLVSDELNRIIDDFEIEARRERENSSSELEPL